MTDISHPDMVAALVKPGDVIAANMTPAEADLWHAATGVAGETSEILDAVMAGETGGALDRDNLIEELGDMEFYLEQTRQNLGLAREVTLPDYDMVGYDLLGIACSLAVAGGTLLDLAKKVAIYKKAVAPEDFIRTLRMAEVSMAAMREHLGVSREVTLQGNIDKLSIRYKGLNYSDDAAQARADKQGE